MLLLLFVCLCLDKSLCLTFDFTGLGSFALLEFLRDSGGWRPVAGGVTATVNQGLSASGSPQEAAGGVCEAAVTPSYTG